VSALPSAPLLGVQAVRRHIGGLLLVAVGILMPWILGSSDYQLAQLENVLSLVMVCVGFNVILGLAGQVFLGPSATLAVGGFVVANLALNHSGFDSLWVMVLVGIGAGVALGLVIAGPALRFRGFYLGIATLYVAVAVPNLAQFLSFTGGSSGLSLIASPTFVPMTGSTLYEIGIAGLLILGVLSSRFTRARLGRRLSALGASEQLAAAVGINGYRSKLAAFLIGSGMIGVASAYYVYTQQFISGASTNPSQSILILAACAIGGFGSVWGPVVGGVIVFIPSVFLTSLDRYQDIVFGCLLIAVVIAYPGGLTAVQWPAPVRRVLDAIIGKRRADDTAHTVASTEGASVSVVAPQAGAADAPPAAGQLGASGLRKTFRGVAAIDDVSITLEAGKVHAIVGPNGSGKTTLLNLLSGFLAADSGTVQLGGDPIGGWQPARIAAQGVARTFQTPKLIPHLSALGNIELGAFKRVGCSDVSSLLALPNARTADLQVRAAALAAADEVGIRDVVDLPAGLLPHGTQRLVEVARALAASPRFLLLDEPAAGLSPAEVTALINAVRAAAAAGIGVALIEHNLPVVFGAAEFVTVLDNGRVLMEGTPDEVAADVRVQRAYLGAESAVADVAPVGRTTQPPLLRVRDLSAGYGGMTAVHGLELDVAPGEMVALVGRNGAGKTTALHAVAGLRSGSNRGTVSLGERELGRSSPSRVAAAGLGLVPEGKRIFTRMSVRDNLLVGLIAKPAANAAEEKQRLDRVCSLFPLLANALDRPSGDLSGGGQQMVSIGQALMGDPAVLMLDEPASGLAPAVVDEMMRALRSLVNDGLGVLFVDQSVERALAWSDRLYAMDNGRIVLSGRSDEVPASALIDIIVGAEIAGRDAATVGQPT
jgi:branched-chain amino acid transport system ATP-binding protein